MNNIKIAKQLLKVAKSLVATDTFGTCDVRAYFQYTLEDGSPCLDILCYNDGTPGYDSEIKSIAQKCSQIVLSSRFRALSAPYMHKCKAKNGTDCTLIHIDFYVPNCKELSQQEIASIKKQLKNRATAILNHWDTIRFVEKWPRLSF